MMPPQSEAFAHAAAANANVAYCAQFCEHPPIYVLRFAAEKIQVPAGVVVAGVVGVVAVVAGGVVVAGVVVAGVVVAGVVAGVVAAGAVVIELHCERFVISHDVSPL